MAEERYDTRTAFERYLQSVETVSLGNGHSDIQMTVMHYARHCT